MLDTCLTAWPDNMFSVFGIDTAEASDQWMLWFVNMITGWCLCALSRSLQFSQCVLSFKMNHMKQSWSHVPHGLSQCFLGFAVESRHLIRQNLCFVNLRSNDFLTKIMSTISMWFKFQLESHEMKFHMYLTWFVTMFSVFNSQTEVSDQMNAWICHSFVTGFVIYLAKIITYISMWLSFKRINMKQCWTLSTCLPFPDYMFLHLVVELRPGIRWELWFFNLWWQYFCSLVQNHASYLNVI